MRAEQLFAKGKYMVIYVSPDTLVPRELNQFLWTVDAPSQHPDKSCEDLSPVILEQFRSLIVVCGTPYRLVRVFQGHGLGWMNKILRKKFPS